MYKGKHATLAVQYRILVPDCSRSGNFRSITGHFRGRRSTEYSYPEDNLAQSDQSNSEEINDKNSQTNSISNIDKTEDKINRTDTEKIKTKDRIRYQSVIRNKRQAENELAVEDEDIVSEQHEHIMMDVVDTRIEGMEEMMGKVMKTMHRLSRKVSDSAYMAKKGQQDHFFFYFCCPHSYSARYFLCSTLY